MSKFVPQFFVVNRQGATLAKNLKTGRGQLPGVWTQTRTETGAPGGAAFDSYGEAAEFGQTLPAASHRLCAIIDQNGKFWTSEDARKAGFLYPPKKAKPASNDAAPVAKAA